MCGESCASVRLRRGRGSTASWSPTSWSRLPVHGVHGITRLRIADASVMPSPVSGNTDAAVLAVTERAADLLTRQEP
ncbi:GMC oxidoreductase [Streptomyces sp. NPDC002018]|uniref:GMC oxidoreductase n=1 Tax=Streptomyces sp. NPDC002018 TaxID=3364629 RepID=UPI0036C0CB94